MVGFPSRCPGAVYGTSSFERASCWLLHQAVLSFLGTEAGDYKLLLSEDFWPLLVIPGPFVMRFPTADGNNAAIISTWRI